MKASLKLMTGAAVALLAVTGLSATAAHALDLESVTASATHDDAGVCQISLSGALDQELSDLLTVPDTQVTVVASVPGGTPVVTPINPGDSGDWTLVVPSTQTGDVTVSYFFAAWDLMAADGSDPIASSPSESTITVNCDAPANTALAASWDPSSATNACPATTAASTVRGSVANFDGNAQVVLTVVRGSYTDPTAQAPVEDFIINNQDVEIAADGLVSASGAEVAMQHLTVTVDACGNIVTPVAPKKVDTAA